LSIMKSNWVILGMSSNENTLSFKTIDAKIREKCYCFYLQIALVNPVGYNPDVEYFFFTSHSSGVFISTQFPFICVVKFVLTLGTLLLH
jgi:hypothetical protein